MNRTTILKTPTFRLLSHAAPMAIALLASASLYAQSMPIALKGGFEVPPVVTAATAEGEFTVAADHTVTGSIKIYGMTPTMAHIHEAAEGKNGPPIVTLNKLSSDTYVVPPDSKLTDSQFLSYMAGNLYVNVHSAQYPNGEIRAQLVRGRTANGPVR